MTPELDIPDELLEVSAAVAASLASVQAAAGSAALAASIMIRVATGFALTNLGPEAAKRRPASTWKDLHEEIESQNGGSGALS